MPLFITNYFLMQLYYISLYHVSHQVTYILILLMQHQIFNLFANKHLEYHSMFVYKY